MHSISLFSMSRNPIVYLLILLFAVACSKTDNHLDITADNALLAYEVGKVELIMRERGMLSQNEQLRPTHRYVEVKATTEDGLLALKNSGIHILPLDLLTEKSGGEGVFYSLMPAGIDFPASVQVRTIADLYLPSGDQRELEIALLEKAGYLSPGDIAPQPLHRQQANIQGKIRIAYPEDGQMRPIRNARIVAVENSRLIESQTDEDGNFLIIGDFFRRIDLYIVFDNGVVQVNRLPKRNLLETFFAAWQKVGSFPAAQWGNIQLDIPITRPEPWSLATLHNSIYEFYDFCDAYGYIKPDKKLVIWADENFLFSTSYAAPMLHHIDQNDRGYIADILQNMLGLDRNIAVTLSNVAAVGLPDIYSHYFTRNPRTRLRTVMFHEMGHATHYMKIGDAFWVRYINYIVQHGGYGEANTPNNGIVAYAEGWAEDISLECYRFLFGSYDPYDPENITPYWIIDGLFYDLWDDHEDEHDHVSGISFRQVYNLFTPEVDHPVVLRDKIKQELSSPTALPEDIDALFGRHGY